MNKKIILNGKDIIKEVERIEIKSDGGICYQPIIKKTTIIFYKSGGVYKVGSKDKFEIFEEKHYEAPKFKVGDYAVKECNDGDLIYIKVDHICFFKEKWICGPHDMKNLRKPTQEELETYFR